jgi:hypothetical protein
LDQLILEITVVTQVSLWKWPIWLWF